MKTYARCQDRCLREALYEQFDTKPKKPDQLHNCCAFCKGKCKCDGNSCESPISPFQGCSLTIHQTNMHKCYKSLGNCKKNIKK